MADFRRRKKADDDVSSASVGRVKNRVAPFRSGAVGNLQCSDNGEISIVEKVARPNFRQAGQEASPHRR